MISGSKKEIGKRLIWVLTCTLIYVLAFRYLEQIGGKHNILSTSLDRAIPYVSVFIIPYLLWFLYVPATMGYFIIKDREGKGYRALIGALIFGCGSFLIISYVFPNAVALRPLISGNGNIFDKLVKMIYTSDTPTNVFPSLHVYNSVACCMAICHDQYLSSKRRIVKGAKILTVLIILATLFIKQHCVFDVIGALAMNAVCYVYFYQEKNEEEVVLQEAESKYIR